MPLSATVDEELLCAPLLDEAAWSRLRGRRIVLQPCGHPGFPRVSPLGTRHFVHARGGACGQHESPEHLHLKAVVARAAAHAGWQADTEVPGDGFVADVLTRGPSGQVAFEVQRSSQILREYERRQARYDAVGIRGVWLVARIPTGYIAGPGLPLFVVDGWRAQPRCVVSGRTMDVPFLVRALLGGHCQWRDSVPGRAVTVETLRQMCPVCATEREVEVARWSRGACECGLPVLHSTGGVGWSQARKCCGHWGPMLTLAAAVRTDASDRAVPAGHWCVSSSGPRRSPGPPG